MKVVSLDEVLRICAEGHREKSPDDDIYRLIGKVDYNAALDHVARLVEKLNVHDLPEDADYIIRQDAINALGDEPLVWTDSEGEVAEHNQWKRDVDAIRAVPSRTRQMGHWQTEDYWDEDKGEFRSRGSCSVCGAFDWDRTYSQGFFYCPNCGCRMMEVEHETD